MRFGLAIGWDGGEGGGLGVPEDSVKLCERKDELQARTQAGWTEKCRRTRMQKQSIPPDASACSGVRSRIASGFLLLLSRHR